MLRKVPVAKRPEKGFTFIEVLVFITIISFLFITLTTTVITSLQRLQVTEHRFYATRYAEEVVEWLRSEKDADWAAFVSRDENAGTGTFYCFNRKLDFLNPTWPPAGLGLPAPDNCVYNGIIDGQPPLIFKRYALLTGVSPDFKQVNIQVIVEWREGNRYYSVPLNTVFTDIDENVNPTPTPIP